MNKHQPHDLKQMQSLPLEAKIIMSKRRIRDWYEWWDGQVYLSFSGGIDSTVLKHLIDSMYTDVPSVFVNTGLEYPEIQRFVSDVKKGRFNCFNTDVHIIRPQMRFDEVLKNYGYPVASKEVAGYVREAKHSKSPKLREMRRQRLMGEYRRPDGQLSEFNCKKWGFLLDAPFEVSDKCCDVMKKKPIQEYVKETGRKGIIGTMAGESRFRKQSWIRYGCNMYAEGSKQLSRPLSFWTKQDVLHYIKKFDVPYCSVYGDIQVKPPEGTEEGQINAIDYLECWNETDILETTGCDRTGCIFCMFGCHLEKEPNRFQRLKETHPRQYEYCIKGGEYAEVRVYDRYGAEINLRHCTKEQIEKWTSANLDNKNFVIKRKWQPNKEGLGLGHVLDYIGVKYD